MTTDVWIKSRIMLCRRFDPISARLSCTRPWTCLHRFATPGEDLLSPPLHAIRSQQSMFLDQVKVQPQGHTLKEDVRCRNSLTTPSRRAPLPPLPALMNRVFRNPKTVTMCFHLSTCLRRATMLGPNANLPWGGICLTHRRIGPNFFDDGSREIKKKVI